MNAMVLPRYSVNVSHLPYHLSDTVTLNQLSPLLSSPPGGDGEAASAKRRPSRSISELDEQLLAKLHMLNQ